MEASVACFSGRGCYSQHLSRQLRCKQNVRRPGGKLNCVSVKCTGYSEEEEWAARNSELCDSSNLHPQLDSIPARSSTSDEPGEPDLFDDWPANLSSSTGGYHPLEFYPTSQLEFSWKDSSQLENVNEAHVLKEHGKIYVILFGVGSSDTEGIYSLRVVEHDDGLPVDTIVAFEFEDDALRYSTLLEATMDHEPTVWPIEWGELLEFCNSAGYRCRLEPRGSLLIPPDYNVGMTDWEKSLRLRRGEFQVLESEPSLQEGRHALADAAIYLEELFSREPHVSAAPHVDSNVVDSQLADPVQLEQLKQSLERLLPRE